MPNVYDLSALPAWRPYAKGTEPHADLPPLWGLSGGCAEPPAIGARVDVLINGFGPSTVLSYFVEHNFLGVAVRPDVRPAWHVRQSPDRHVALVFGAEIRPEALPTAGQIWQRAHADARGWRKRRGNGAAVTDRIIRNHFGLSRDGGHLGAVEAGTVSTVHELYSRAFHVAAFVGP